MWEIDQRAFALSRFKVIHKPTDSPIMVQIGGKWKSPAIEAPVVALAMGHTTANGQLVSLVVVNEFSIMSGLGLKRLPQIRAFQQTPELSHIKNRDDLIPFATSGYTVVEGSTKLTTVEITDGRIERFVELAKIDPGVAPKCRY